MNWKEQFERDLTELWQLYEKAKQSEIRDMQYEMLQAISVYNDKILSIEDFISTEIIEKLFAEISLPEYSHKDCPLPQTCIGYQNAESDLARLCPFLT